jgi:hypothetical protein
MNYSPVRCGGRLRKVAGASALLLGGCLGAGEESPLTYTPPPNSTLPPISSPPTAPPPAPLAPSGTIVIEVLDEEGAPFPGVFVSVGSSPSLDATGTTSEDGTVRIVAEAGSQTAYLRSLPVDDRWLWTRLNVVVPEEGEAHYRLHMLPSSQVAPALLPAQVQPGSLSADGTELILEVGLVMTPSPGFTAPATYSKGPLLVFDHCWAILDENTGEARCYWESIHETLALEYDEVGTPAESPPANVAMLLVDHSGDTQAADSNGDRWRAARYFAREFTARSGGGLLAVAAFSGGPEASVPFSPLLPPPMGNAADPATLFTSDADALQDMLDPDHFTSNGNRDTPEAIAAALQLMATHAPEGTRALVVITGPLESDPDDATLSRLAELRAAVGARVLLVSRPLEEQTVARARLAALATALEATTVVAGYPTDWPDYYGETDNGQVQALELATAWLTGDPLPSLKATFRVRTTPDKPFRSGELLRSELQVESQECPMGCWMVPIAFAARIP